MRLDGQTCSETSGKRQRPSLGGSSRPISNTTATIINVNASVSAPSSCRLNEHPVPTSSSPLLHVTDEFSGEVFLVDTGAEVSIVLPKRGDKETRVGAKLTAANGSGILTYGKRKRSIKLQCGEFAWKFIVAKAKNIIGADMLRRFMLVPDLHRRKLWNTNSFSIARGFLQPVPDSIRGISMVVESETGSFEEEIRRVVKQRPKLTEQTFWLAEAPHGIEHEIITTGQPIRCRPRRQNPEKLAIAKAEFRFLVEMGIASRSNSPWASPLHITPKPNGGWRPCGDFRRLNAVTVPDSYSVPRIHDFANGLAGRKWFSKVDLVKGYHQVPIKLEDQPKTAITTPFGLYQFRRMPFGLRNAGATFQRLMDSIFQEFDFVFVYLDDVLIASKSKEEHRRHLSLFFDRLEKHGLFLQASKCQFGVEELEFLGHLVNKEGIKTVPKKVEAIRDYPEPIGAKDPVQAMERFLGMYVFYHRFVPNAAELLRPLYDAMVQDVSPGGNTKSSTVTKPRRPKKRLVWSQDTSEAFSQAKNAMVRATQLSHPVVGAKLAVTTDASDTAIGAVLEQFVEGSWQPLGFFSRKLRGAQLRYSAYDRELLGIHMSIKHFLYYVEGQPFTVFTDHMPLVNAIKMKGDTQSPRQARQLSSISEHTTDVQHVAGKANVVADALSRIEFDPPARSSEENFDDDAVQPLVCHSIAQGVDYEALALAQVESEDIQLYRTACTGLKLKDISFADGSFTVLCDVSTGKPRPIVPEAWREAIFHAVHGLSHPGIEATKKLVSAKFVWHGLKKYVGQRAKQCLECQRSKVQRHTKAPLQKLPTPKLRFGHVQIDLVGPLPECQGFKYLMTVIDRFTRWPEAVPIKEMDTDTVAKAYITNWVSRMGVPADMTSDRGPQFVSRLWQAMSQYLGTQLHPTTSYHPQANGLVERWHRTLKSSIMARVEAAGSDWLNQLPWILLGLRITPKEDLDGASPAEMVYGQTLTIPGDMIQTGPQEQVSQHLRDIRAQMENLKPKPTSAHGAKTAGFHVPKALETAQYVYIRRSETKRSLQTPYTGPYTVIARADKWFDVQVGTRTERISIDRLKVAHVAPGDVEVAQPPLRGRPPGSTTVNGPVNKRSAKAAIATPTPMQADDHGPNIGQPLFPAPPPGGCLPPSSPETPPTYAQVTSRCGRKIKPAPRLNL